MQTNKEHKMKIPYHQTVMTKHKMHSTVEQRTQLLEKIEYNVFAFPAMFCAVDFLSDSGVSSMFDNQWSFLFLGDESYGRNDGYFVLLEVMRDIFERKEPKYSFKELLLPNSNFEKIVSEMMSEEKGGFFNGGVAQLERPNSFLVPQGRCAEFLLFQSLRQSLNEQTNKTDLKYYIPSNGFFDTTRANCMQQNFEAHDIFEQSLTQESPIYEVGVINHFKGNMPIVPLIEYIKAKGPENVPLILMTITNNTAAGQCVSLKNLKQVKEVAQKYNIPLWIDSCRFAENVFFIWKYEKTGLTIEEIIKEIYSLADGFHISFKKDGLANIGGGMFFKDQGLFHKKFSTANVDIGNRIKQNQILIFGNDSYGGMSGRDIMTIARGLYEVIKVDYLDKRIQQVQQLAVDLAIAGIPVVLPPGGHAVFIDINRFFPDRHWSDFAGVGLTVELLRRYAIRCCELGAFAFEWDLREQLEEVQPPNFVRLAVPRNVYGQEHINYTVKALIELYHQKDSIPNMKIIRGKNIPLRHFQAGMKPEYIEISKQKSEMHELINNKFHIYNQLNRSITKEIHDLVRIQSDTLLEKKSKKKFEDKIEEKSESQEQLSPSKITKK